MTIYTVTNLLNGRVYVGQTVRSVKQRWREHVKDSSYCRYLKHAIAMYGKDNFKVEEIASAFDLEELDRLEEYFIRYFNSMVPNGYNLNSGGKVLRASEETKAKMSRTRTGRPLLKNRGRKAWNKGLKTGLKQTKEHVDRRVLAANEVRRRKIICLNTGEIFNSLKEAAIKHGLSRSNLSGVLNGRRKTVSGLTFQFL